VCSSDLIKAPFDGVIGLRYVSDGGYVTPNVLIASLQNVSTMKAEFSVPERHINQLTNGAEVLVRVAESNEPHRGVVYAVESKIDPGTRTIKARARVPNPRGRLTPGAFGKVEITLQRIPAAVVVPSGAVVPDLAGEFVYVHRDGKARVTPVQTGLRTERATQIITGLAAGDTLIVSGLLQLSDGRPVDIRTLLTE
jgi:membrane fusion protein (multidrug efflux system)